MFLTQIDLASLPYIASWFLGKTRADFQKFLSKQNTKKFWFFVIEGGIVPDYGECVDIIGNTPNEYNDVLVLFEGTTFVKAYTVTSNPGEYWVKKKRHSNQPVANLVHDLWLFKKGKHRGYRALQQATAVRVWRTFDGDNRVDETGEYVDSGYFGIHIHGGGKKKQDVGKWSAGCTAFLGGHGCKSPFSDFIKRVYFALKNEHARLPGIFWNGKDLLRFRHAVKKNLLFLGIGDYAGIDLKLAPTLCLGQGGSVSEPRPQGIFFWVKVLQKVLNRIKYLHPKTFRYGFLKHDGDFGKKTEAAVKELQRVRGFTETGVCSMFEWNAILGLL